jgi:hypothetical protein
MGSESMTAFHDRLKIAITLSASICFFPTASEAVTTFYTTQAAFIAAAPGAFLLENFSTALPKDAAIPAIALPSGTYSGSNNVVVASPGYTNFGAAVVQPTTQIILTASGNENISALFAAPYHAVGFEAFFNGSGPLTLTVFGSGGSILGTLPIASGLDPATGLADRGYLGFTSDSLIFGFNWLATGGETLNTGYTNISAATTLPTSETPLPAALPLFATGLGALGLLTWRRKRKAVTT